MDILGGSLVLILFFSYFFLWKIKRRLQVREDGIDPEVFDRSASPLQLYLGKCLKVLTLYAVAIIILHILNLQFASLFNRFGPLNRLGFKLAGFGIGCIGLFICYLSQREMGRSWRVGIDEQVRTALITNGMYRLIRNPTYLGLFLVNLGIWLIWPTWTVSLLNFFFIFSLEIQVRCEEEFLERTHGEAFLEYKRRSKRYIPFIY